MNGGEIADARKRRILRNVAFIFLSMAAMLGLITWRAPLWILDTTTNCRLRLNGVQSDYVTVNGYKIHYLVGGAGKPLILVHGLGSRATDWSELIPQFIDAGYRVYALDLLGYGRSAQPKDASYSIPEEASIVEGFVDSQNLKQVDMAGWSMGGWIAMQVALHEPARIRRLVLLDSAGLFFKPAFDASVFEPKSPVQLAALEALLIPRPRAMPQFLALAMLRRGEEIGWVVRRSVQSMMSGRDLLDGKLGALNMPVLVGWGQEDHLIPLSTAYDLHAQIPQSVLAVYEGCGHLAPGLCADLVGPNVIKFLNVNPAPRAEVEQIHEGEHRALVLGF